MIALDFSILSSPVPVKVWVWFPFRKKMYKKLKIWFYFSVSLQEMLPDIQWGFFYWCYWDLSTLGLWCRFYVEVPVPNVNLFGSSPPPPLTLTRVGLSPRQLRLRLRHKASTTNFFTSIKKTNSHYKRPKNLYKIYIWIFSNGCALFFY